MQSSSSNNPLVLVAVIAIFAIALILVIVSAIRRREESFEGKVIDKDIQENVVQNQPINQQPGITFGNTGAVTHAYRVKVQTDTGKVINYQISEGLYETIKIGDRVSKPKGTTTLSIVNSDRDDATAAK